MSTLETPGAFDALEKAQPDEPMFPLLAHDPCAPAAITEWARLRRNRAISLWGESSSAADKLLLANELAQCANAEEIALAMADWRSEHGAVEGVRSSYQEIARSAEEVAEADRRQRRATVMRNFREAAYHVSEARDVLADLELLSDDAREQIELELKWINDQAEAMQPKREAYAAEPSLDLGAPTHGR